MTIGFIGVGHLASALLSGMLHSKQYSVSQLILYDKMKDMTDWRQKGAKVVNSERDVVAASDIIIFAIRPADFAEAFDNLRTSNTEGKVFVSTAAAVTTAYISEGLGRPSKIVRTMPNTPLALGLGATAMSASSQVTAEELLYIKSIFETCGIVEMLPEEQMNQIIAVNGSSPAFVYLFAETMAKAAVEIGIDSDVALRLIVQTFRGSVAMMENSGKELSTLIREVAVPGGTTLAALQQFEKDHFYAVVKRAMQACIDRADELAR